MESEQACSMHERTLVALVDGHLAATNTQTNPSAVSRQVSSSGSHFVSPPFAHVSTNGAVVVVISGAVVVSAVVAVVVDGCGFSISSNERDLNRMLQNPALVRGAQFV